ncbi:MAG: GNAT family N-acetyltransferase [Pseudomonadota bacterium]
MSEDPIILRNYRFADADWLTALHGALYAQADGFDDTFAPLVGDILAQFARHHDPSRERGWVAQRGEDRLGSIFCVDNGENIAKLRLFLVAPETRGQGLGFRLLQACVNFARDAGYTHLTLWTHESHKAACALYARCGFALESSKPVHSFGVDLVEQTWSRDLKTPL